MKKPTGSVQYRFYKLKTEKTEQKKTEPNRKNRVKTEKTKINQAKPVWTGFFPKKPNLTEIGRFKPVSVFFFNFSLVIFFDKNRTEPKLLIPMFGA